MVEDIRHRQERIEFLEDYITGLTEKIDELTEGRDLEKMIRSIEFRIETLQKADGLFNGQLKDLTTELKDLNAAYEKIKPVIEQLENERAYYRVVQSEL